MIDARRLSALLLAALLAAPPAAQAAPAPTAAKAASAPIGQDTAAMRDAALRYETRLLPTGDQGLDTQLAEASRLKALAADAPVDAFGLVARAGAESRPLEDVLRAGGWWAPLVEIRIAGEPASAPGLAERIAARFPLGGEDAVPVEVRIDTGPRYTLRRIALRPAQPADAAAIAALGPPPGLADGAPARTDPILDAEAALIERLRRGGHPLASVVDREVTVDHDAARMDVVWTLAAGPRTSFAVPVITGETAVDPALTARVAGRLEGEPFSPQRLERARRDLLALGAFDTVRARAADRLDAAGRLPVTFAVTDRPRNAAGVTLAYETNYGLSGRVYYERRNLFGNAETLRVEAEVSRLGDGTEVADPNYRAGAALRRPGLFGGRTTSVTEAYGVRERLFAYDRDAFVAATLLEHPLGDHWLLRGGPTFENGRVGRDGSMPPFMLFGVVLGARYDTTDSLLDPRRGLRADATVIPYSDLLETGGFVRATGTLRTYFDISGDGGSVVALRGTLGSLLGADREVPLDKRFYAGGGGSVRGYGFQRIGPRDANGRPVGGSSLVEGSAELRQRVRGNIGVVAFVDAGSVGEMETPDFSDLRFGAGLGLRYATAIGPLRLDIGVPLNREPGDSRYGIYVGLGQSF
ncbi:autotransporter assembly complex family protein [Falsiroseomonas sp.]|uniref:autotransporter assembly complex protein TamA n=1 Tax=Falsiroseomonas sp. TaxID=2870721 RepID=UPI0034A28CC5